MPRISELQKLKNIASAKLNEVKNKIHRRTYTSIVDKIQMKDRKDTIKKIIAELDAIKNIVTVEKVEPKKRLTLGKIKVAKKEVEKIVEQKKKLLEQIRAPRVVKNKFISKKLIDKIKFFTKYAYTYANVDTLEQLYDNILVNMMAGINNQPFTSATIFIRNRESGKIRRISIPIGDMSTYEDFKDRLDAISNGDVAGSDSINLDENEIILTNFALAQARISGNGVSESMMFLTVGIEESRSVNPKSKKEFGNKDCAFQCLKHCGVKYKGNIAELRDIEKLVRFISESDLNINVICNSFLIKRNVLDIVNNKVSTIKMIKAKNGEMRKNVCAPLNVDTDMEIVYLHKVINAEHTIIYDEFNCHFDVVKNNEIVVCDDVFISNSFKIIKGDKIIFTARQVNLNSKAKPIDSVEIRFIIFDYETVIDFDESSCMRPYSLSILNLNNKQLEDLTTADEEGDMEKIAFIRKKHCLTFLGYDCSEKFIDWIIENQNDKSFVFIGFNNANFDNFIFLDALLRRQESNSETEFSVSDIFYNGSQLLNFHMCGRHNTFDIHKHLMGSLKANCDSFKIKSCAKKSFDHNKAQQLYCEDKLIDFITDNDELKEYNEYDVLATAVLFCKYRRALDAIEATKSYASDLHNVKTVGSLIYKVFEDNKKKKGFDLPKLTFEQYDDLQKSKIAGRVELFNGVQKVEERLVSTDVCSLYPYVMSVLNCYYPVGKELILVDEYKGDDVIGFYYCDIDQSNLKGMNLPNIYAKKTEIENNWAYEGVLENYLISNVMIGLLRKYKCEVVIKNGFVFPDKKKSCDMFDFLLDFMKAKNDQDTLKSKKDSNYNPALRETLKLLMNSLSGKVIEGLHTEKTQDVNSVAEYEKIKGKAESINFINAIGGKLFVTYEVSAESLCAKSQRPIYLGVLIYDYAKRYMFENSYSKIGLKELLYTDTDASKFRHKKFIEWKNWVDEENVCVPHWEEVELIDDRYKTHKIYETGSKVFGSFEDELEDMVGEKYTFYCLEKKSWLYDIDGHSKFRFKGLNGAARMLTLKEDFIGSKIIKHKATDKKEACEETKYYIKSREEDIHNYYQENKNTAIECGNEVKFFEQIYTTGEAYVLCNSFRKIVKNSAHNVELGNESKYNNLMNKIQVNYMMKHINLRKNKI
jgi:hypothetical protein